MKRKIKCGSKRLKSFSDLYQIKNSGRYGLVIGWVFFMVLLANFSSAVYAFCPAAFSALPVQSYPDSLSMDVLRQGRLRITYYSYFQENSVIRKETSQSVLQLSRLDSFFDVILKDSLVAYGKAEITGTASIEGSFSSNESLSRKRAHAFRDFLESRYQLASYFPVVVSWIAEDWAYLSLCIQQSDKSSPIAPWKEDILRIIREVSVYDGREAQLIKLGNGVPFRYMKTHFFPRQRRAIITMIYDMKQALEKHYRQTLPDTVAERIVAGSFLSSDEARLFMNDRGILSLPVNLSVASVAKDAWLIPVVDNEIPASYVLTQQSRLKYVLEKAMTVISDAEKQVEAIYTPATVLKPSLITDTIVQKIVINHTDTVYIREYNNLARVSSPFCVIVKTNLLALGGITPEPALRAPMSNLELELVFSRRLSFSLSGLYASSHSLSDYHLWSATAYTGEVRYKVLPVHQYSGLYAGLYGRGGDFDIQQKSTSSATADAVVNSYDTGRYYEAGLSAGYSLFITPRWVVEAGASCGFRHKRYMPYRNGSSEQYATGVRSSKNSFELTGLSLSIGYVIGKRK